MPDLATQLIVFNDHVDLEKDPDTIFRATAEAGFTAVETQLTDPIRLRGRLIAHGLKHAGAHVTPAQLREPQRWVDYLNTTGATDICSSGLLQWHQRTLSDHDATIEVLNRAGRLLRASGIYLHYHNHDFELLENPVPGKTTLDLLVERVDPDAIDFCIDVGWLHRAGIEPAAFLTQFADRIGYLHLKDWDGEAWVPLGQGQVNLPSIIKIIPDIKRVRWITCEQDKTPDNPARCLRISREWCSRHLPLYS